MKSVPLLVLKQWFFRSLQALCAYEPGHAEHFIGLSAWAGLLDAERRFRHVKGYRHVKLLLGAWPRDVKGPTLDALRKRV